MVMGDFNHGNIQCDTLDSTGVEDQQSMWLIHDNFLTQHVLEPTRGARVHYSLRHANVYPIPVTRTDPYKNSIVPWGLCNWQ